MREMIVSELSRTVNDFAQGLAHLLPRVLVMLIIILAGWVVAYLLKAVLRSILRLLKFDRLSENAGTAQLLNKAALPPSSELLGRLVFWLVLLGFILVGVDALGIIGLREDIGHFFLFLPRLLVALLLLFFGMLAASFFSRAALLAAVNANFPSPRILSNTTRVVILMLAIAMAFEQLGLAETTILVAFSIIFGALMLGLAIAFGWGGRHLAQQFLENRLSDKKSQEKKEDELSPL
jgi:Mechanosensitive ion channel, conserved TM helix